MGRIDDDRNLAKLLASLIDELGVGMNESTSVHEALQSAYNLGHDAGRLLQMKNDGLSSWIEQWQSKCDELAKCRAIVSTVRRALGEP
jgi:hypothetical protein